jgi:hypothetical protein
VEGDEGTFATEPNETRARGGVPVTEHIGQHHQQPPVTELEERLHMLEGRVTALADAVRVLAHGLEDLPTAGPGGNRAAEAARRAYDLLLVAEPRPPDTQPTAGDPDT